MYVFVTNPTETGLQYEMSLVVAILFVSQRRGVYLVILINGSVPALFKKWPMFQCLEFKVVTGRL